MLYLFQFCCFFYIFEFYAFFQLISVLSCLFWMCISFNHSSCGWFLLMISHWFEWWSVYLVRMCVYILTILYYFCCCVLVWVYWIGTMISTICMNVCVRFVMLYGNYVIYRCCSFIQQDLDFCILYYTHYIQCVFFFNLIFNNAQAHCFIYDRKSMTFMKLCLWFLFLFFFSTIVTINWHMIFDFFVIFHFSLNFIDFNFNYVLNIWNLYVCMDGCMLWLSISFSVSISLSIHQICIWKARTPKIKIIHSKQFAFVL